MTARLTDKMIDDYLSIGVQLERTSGVIRGVDAVALLHEVADRRRAAQDPESGLDAWLTAPASDDGLLADAIAEASRCREALKAIAARATDITGKSRNADIIDLARSALDHGQDPYAVGVMAGPQ